VVGPRLFLNPITRLVSSDGGRTKIVSVLIDSNSGRRVRDWPVKAREGLPFTPLTATERPARQAPSSFGSGVCLIFVANPLTDDGILAYSASCESGRSHLRVISRQQIPCGTNKTDTHRLHGYGPE